MIGLVKLARVAREDIFGMSLRGELVRSAMGSAMIRVAATALAFGASLLYARTLGPHGYGVYAYVLAWAGLLAIPVGLGFPEYLVREAARHELPLLTLSRWVDQRVLMTGVIAALMLALASIPPIAGKARPLFLLAAPYPLLTVLAQTRQSLLRARGHVVAGSWPMLLTPLLAVSGLTCLYFMQKSLAPAEVMAALTLAAFAPVGINHLQLRRLAARSNYGGQSALSPIRMKASLPFMWLGVLYLINSRADLIMVGTIKGAHAAGIYAVAARAGEVVPFFLAAANMALAPQVAKLYKAADRSRLQRLVTAASRRVFFLSLPLALLFLISARPLLGLLYGQAFSSGATALQILAGAQLFSVAAGSVGLILNMTGHERLTGAGIAISVAVNLLLNAILIPFWGITGAAVATGSSIVVWNLLLWFFVRRRLKLGPSTLGF